MKARDMLLGMVGVALAAVFALVLSSLPAAAANDPPPGGGSVVGDWKVTDSRGYNNTTIYIESGNVTITAQGSLSFTNLSLVFNSTNDGTYFIEVQAGGTLLTDNGTKITSNRSDIHYKFIVKGALSMNNTGVSEVWGNSAGWDGGIQLYSSKVSISNSTISSGRTGGISIFNCSPEITQNKIIQNGQHGGSPWYAYGIYAYNTMGNITGNYIGLNEYATPGFTVDYYYQPMENEGTYWNGHWYYDWGSGDRYRYEYDFNIWAGEHSGKGVYIEGGSTARVANNTIEKNGWAKMDYTGTWSGPYWEDATHYYYLSLYQYWIPTCTGMGLYSGNSSLTISGNVLDRNGYEVCWEIYQNWWDSSKYILPNQSGIGVRMVNSFGDLTSNKITNAWINIDNLQSSPNITGNTISTNYGSDPNNWYYSASFVPGGIGYGIKNNKCAPWIFNNTISLTVNDGSWWLNNEARMAVRTMVGIEIYDAKGARIENNKITGTGNMEGSTLFFGINVTMKSTAKVLNDTVEYKYPNNWGGNPISSFHKCIQVAIASSAEITNCTAKGPAPGGQGGGQPPKCAGLFVGFGSTVTITDVRVSQGAYGLYVRDSSSATASQLSIIDASAVGVTVESSTLTLTGGKVLGLMRGLQALACRVNYSDCVLSNGMEFLLDRAAVVELFNTTHTRGTTQLLDKDSWLNVTWPVRTTVTWQNGAPAENADVSFLDLKSVEMFRGTTGADGQTKGGPVRVLEYQGHDGIIIKYTPHRVSASRGRASSTNLYMLDAAIDLQFRLFDDVPPEITVTSPLDGALLNTRPMFMEGEAYDTEAGIQDQVVIINIDNTGEVRVPVVNGHWNYTHDVPDGAHIARVRAQDLVGNSALRTVSFTLDNVAPGLQVLSPLEGGYTNQRTITVTGITDDGALVTVNGAQAALNGRYFKAPVSLDYGPNTITVTAADSSGNVRTVEVHVTLDTVPPVIDILSPAQGAHTNQNLLTVQGAAEQDATVTVNGYAAQLSGADFEALVELSEGINTITVRAVDRAGNTNTVTLLVTLDTRAPDLVMFTPRDELWTSVGRVLVSGSTEQEATVTINGQSTSVANTQFQTYLGLAEGANTITIIASDLAGNRKVVTLTVFLDTRAPDLVVTSPVDRTAVASRVVRVSGSVDFGAEVRVNGERVPVVDFVFSTTVEFNEDGAQVIEITAMDLAGNVASMTRSLTIDTSSPAVNITSPPDFLRTRLRTITVSGQTEPYAKVVVNTETVVVVGRDGFFSVPVVLEDGKNRITVQATDPAGNTATSFVEVTRVAPPVSVKADLSWALHLSGLLIGVALAFPIGAYMLARSMGRRRAGVLAELETARVAREAKKAAGARPTVERFAPKTAPQVRPPAEPEPPAPQPATPPPAEAGGVVPNSAEADFAMAKPPKPEDAPAAPAVPKTGLRDKAKSTEVAPDDTDQMVRMSGKKPKAAEPGQTSKPADDTKSMKDKGTEVEDEAGETEMPDTAAPKKHRSR